MADTAEGKPTKKFFVDMITRDISLQDCILDLLDNCVDGARRTANERKPVRRGRRFAGFNAMIELDGNHCRIVDNCGGIPRHVAEHYAFRFGRVDAFQPDKLGIGLYGVGMKRAIFKLGKVGQVKSRLGTSGFQVNVNVAKWRDDEENWDFPIVDSKEVQPKGTTVEISPLWEHVSDVVQDPRFRDELRQSIARDYAFLISQGFSVAVNQRAVAPYSFVFRKGGGFAPMRTRDTKSGVTIEVFAGFAESPPDSIEVKDEHKRKHDPFGWYVTCNDRVVLAADKTSRTVWGRDGFNRWHPQYIGFLGIVRFSSNDPTKLPWTTTKRDIDDTTEVYRIALERMKSATDRCIDYTETRRGNTEHAGKREAEAKAVDALMLPMRATPLFPKIPKGRKKDPTITYTVTRTELERAKELLGDPHMRNGEVGLRTFRLFMDGAE